MTGLLSGLLAVAGILLLSAALGAAVVTGRLAPPGPDWRPERFAWGLAAGLALLSASVPLGFALSLPPGWIPWLSASAAAFALARLLRRLSSGRPREGAAGPAAAVLAALAAAGVSAYAFRALTEPMWGNDFLAIWGFKAKTIFGSGSLPSRLWEWPDLSFSHPEYPLGIPFLYAGVAFLIGRWDDHALALVFPVLQGATLALLVGFLRRRGTPSTVAWGAAALLAFFEPLYRAFTTGMADVPLSFGLLLLGTALCDAMEREAGALSRLGLASVVAAATKNEGLFAVGVAALIALLAYRGDSRGRLRLAGALLIPALGVAAAHRALRGPVPLRDFDFGLLGSPELPARIARGLETVASEILAPAWPAWVAGGLLVAAGARSRDGDRLLWLAAVPAFAYLFLPGLCVHGPEWLVRSAVSRTWSALAPLAAAGIALRLAPVLSARDGSSGSGTGRSASSPSHGGWRPSIPES